jgi:glycosyltransferase involved in cell wall biosynthesis
MRIIHALHDFLPKHRAGSELYVRALAAEQQRRGHLPHVLCAEYDPARPHGAFRWRVYDGIPVIEIVNNWRFRSFRESYRSEFIANRMDHALSAVQPDVVHVHNLLNLTFALPGLARRRGAAVVATLHDYTLACPSGGQRVHTSESHVCETIDPERCARCFRESPWSAQMRLARLPAGRVGKVAYRVSRKLLRHMPARAAGALRNGNDVTPADIRSRLDEARRVFDAIDLFVAPSQALADEYLRFGLPASRIRVSDYGFEPLSRPSHARGPRLRVGFIGTIVWHKGVHVLLEAVSTLPPDAVEVRIHGDPDCFPTYGRMLRHRAQRLPHVRFMGAFAESELPTVLGGLDVLVVPSLWPENSPLVVHEAFMGGVPVVGARVGGIPELVAHGRHGLLYDAYSSADLRRALSQFLDDPALLERMAANLPAVKPIGVDADEWDQRYREAAGVCERCP